MFLPSQIYDGVLVLESTENEEKEKKVKSLSRVWLFATPWTIAYQAPLSMGFSSKSTGVGCHFLLQGIVPTQGSNLGLLHCRQVLYRWAIREAYRN